MHLEFEMEKKLYFKITDLSNSEFFQAMANTGFLENWAIGRLGEE